MNKLDRLNISKYNKKVNLLIELKDILIVIRKIEKRIMRLDFIIKKYGDYESIKYKRIVLYNCLCNLNKVFNELLEY